jgi:hypothetical protein
MTEAEWLASGSPGDMLRILQNRSLLSRRKTRLFAVACCRRTWDLFTDEHSRRAVVVAEWDIDSLTNKEAVRVAERGAAPGAGMWVRDAPRDAAWVALTAGRLTAEGPAAVDVPGVAAALDLLAVATASPDAARHDQATLLRDCFGPLPFRRLALPRSLLTANVMALAQAAYADRSFSSSKLDPERLAILADALEEAGVVDAAILSHLRSPGGVHVRGCFAVDAVLGRS